MPAHHIDTPISSDTLPPLAAAIWRTVAYADVFDYPLTMAEIHRYLDGEAASLPLVQATLCAGGPLARYVVPADAHYYTLLGRESLVAVRQERLRVWQALWPEAERYGRILAALPFVRMVAVTGSLAVGNAERGADIDYLIVTENGRLWLCRAFTIALVRLAARRGVTLCPNYFLSQRALEFAGHNLYVAREVTQMVPLFGGATYRSLRQCNAWTQTYLPNADGPPRSLLPQSKPTAWLQTVTELPLRTPLGTAVEQWEMQRKIRKFKSLPRPLAETNFSPDHCKGHFHGHNQRIITAYQTKVDWFNLPD